MKQIAIINYSLQNENRVSDIEFILNKFKNSGIDTMIIGQNSIQNPSELNIDYYIYSSSYDNFHNGPYVKKWYATSSFRVDLKLRHNFINLIKNLKIGANMASNLGYEGFIFLDDSVTLSNNDFDKVINDFRSLTDKNMMFVKPIDSEYSFNLFAGKTSYFIENFNLEDSSETWLDETNRFRDLETIEKILYHNFSKDEDTFILINSELRNYIPSSEIKDVLFGHNEVLLLANSLERDQCVVFIYNSSEVDKIYKLSLGLKEKNIYLNPGKLYSEIIPINSDLILVEVVKVTETSEEYESIEIFNTNTDYKTLSKIGVFTGLN